MSLLTVSAAKGKLSIVTNIIELKKKDDQLKIEKKEAATKGESDSSTDSDISDSDSTDSDDFESSRALDLFLRGGRANNKRRPVSFVTEALGLAAESGHWDIVRILLKNTKTVSKKAVGWSVR